MVDDKDFFQKTKAYIRQLSPDLVSRVHLYDEKTPLFDEFEIEQEVQKVYADKVWIRKGSHLVIQTTEAMTTIDVNTGRNVGRDDQAATILDTNITAAKEIAKQLRLRDLAGSSWWTSSTWTPRTTARSWSASSARRCAAIARPSRWPEPSASSASWR